jgi:hypothetical protein
MGINFNFLKKKKYEKKQLNLKLKKNKRLKTSIFFLGFFSNNRLLTKLGSYRNKRTNRLNFIKKLNKLNHKNFILNFFLFIKFFSMILVSKCLKFNSYFFYKIKYGMIIKLLLLNSLLILKKYEIFFFQKNK